MKRPATGERYYHFKHDPNKGKNDHLYEIVGLALHTENEEELVIYKPLYESEYSLFARPVENFCEHINREEYNGPRFVKIES